jgi:hypothetical protein
MKLIRRCFLVCGLAIILLPGCAKRETPVVAGIRTQTLHFGNGEDPATLDPQTFTMGAEWMILSTARGGKGKTWLEDKSLTKPAAQLTNEALEIMRVVVTAKKRPIRAPPVPTPLPMYRGLLESFSGSASAARRAGNPPMNSILHRIDHA